MKQSRNNPKIIRLYFYRTRQRRINRSKTATVAKYVQFLYNIS